MGVTEEETASATPNTTKERARVVTVTREAEEEEVRAQAAGGEEFASQLPRQTVAPAAKRVALPPTAPRKRVHVQWGNLEGTKVTARPPTYR